MSPLTTLSLCLLLCGAEPEATAPGGPTQEIYKRVGDVNLPMFIFRPADQKPGDRRPAIVFFFGGGWRSGSTQQFYPHCEHLAARGMVALAADYRVASRHGVKVAACIEDAKSAVRWVRANADRLGIDPERIVAAGGSAGGHLAACTALVPGFEAESEKVSSRPNALALFNPALVLAPVAGKRDLPEARLTELQARLGVEPQAASPHHHVKAGAPPTIIFHGEADTTVPYATAEWFTAAMQAAGNRCELHGYPGQPHGFFNQGRGGGQHYRDTVARLEAFLESLDYLPAAQAKNDVP